MKILPKICILLLIGLLVACTLNSKYEQFYTIDNSNWEKDSTLTFPVYFNHDSQAYNLSVNIRNKRDYAYSNIWLFVNIKSPNGDQLIDTAEFKLATPAGKWLGSGIGDLFDNKFTYKENISFPDSGTYIISIQQGMRDDILEGIDALGISIEKTK